MLGVLVCGVLGFASSAWVVDMWAVTGVVGALCAAAAFAMFSSAHAAIATLAGVGVAVGATIFAGPDVQGPGFDLVAWLCGCVMIYAAVAYLRRPQMAPTS
jgi:hypothetical protein